MFKEADHNRQLDIFNDKSLNMCKCAHPWYLRPRSLAQHVLYFDHLKDWQDRIQSRMRMQWCRAGKQVWFRRALRLFEIGDAVPHIIWFAIVWLYAQKKRWLVSEMFCSTELTSSSQVQHLRKVRVWTVGLLVVTLLGIHVISLSTRHFSSASTKIQPTLSLQSWKRKCLCCFIRTQRV